MKKWLSLGILLTVSCCVFGCAKSVRPTLSVESMDTPAHHVETGWQLIQTRNYQAALESFEEALSVAPESSFALSGKSVSLTMLGQEDEAVRSAESALRHARTDAEKAKAHIAVMKELAAFRPEGWLEKSRSEYEAVIDDGQDLAEATLLMANAYAVAKAYDQAAGLYAQVIRMGGAEGKESSRAWEDMSETRRAEADQRAAADIAGKAAVTRGEFAAVLVEGLGLHQVVALLEQARLEPDFVTPQELIEDNGKATAPIPDDVENHPLKLDMTTVMALRFRGLQPLPSGKFRPDAPMTRVEAAMVLQDLASILALVPYGSVPISWADTSFVDVPSGYYASGAIDFCLTYGLLTPRGVGRFEPAEPLTGLEAVKCVMEIRRNIASRYGDPKGKDCNAEVQDNDWQAKLFLAILKSGMMFFL